MYRSPFAILRTLLLLAMLVPAILAPLHAAADNRHLPADDATQVSRTVLEISRLQQHANGNELYDWLGLTSRELISRESFVTWLDDADHFRPTVDPQILDITFGDWVWPVTGATLPQIATVHLALAGEQGGLQVTSLFTWHFQFDTASHRWRWLFPADLARMQEIRQYPAPVLAFASTFDDPGYLAIDHFWAGVLADTEIPYRPVQNIIEVTEQPVITGCGVESDMERIGIYTCLLDQTIYYSPVLKQMMTSQFGETGWLMVIAHEWSHQIQAEFGIRYGAEPELDDGHYILELESQADCLMGIYVQAAIGSGTLTRSDFMLAHRLLGTYGDYAGMPWDSTNAHGDASQRITSFDTGYFGGFVGCGLDLDPA